MPKYKNSFVQNLFIKASVLQQVAYRHIKGLADFVKSKYCRVSESGFDSCRAGPRGDLLERSGVAAPPSWFSEVEIGVREAQGDPSR